MHQTTYHSQIGSDRPVLFEIRSLAHTYPDGQPALESVDLTIFSGDRIALVGHNGAGKTTLIKHLNGLYRAQQGEILYKGSRIEGDNLTRAQLEAGILFQDPDDQLFCSTIFEDVAFGPLNQGLNAADVNGRVRHALRQVGLDRFAYKAPHHLSYGQRKRAALATLLSMRPEVLILDEPTANLDSKQEKLFWELLQNFPGTLVVISHDLAFTYGICERAVVLEKGRVHHDYSMKELVSQRSFLRSHGLDFTFRFSCCQDDPDGAPHDHGHSHSTPHDHTHDHAHPAAPPVGGPIGPAGCTCGAPGAHRNPGDPPSPLLLLEDYSYRYPDSTWGIRNVSFEIHEGESVAILGENGAGKSTLARCLMGLAGGKGTHAFAGKPVTPKNRNLLWREMGMVFQNPIDQLFCPSCWEEVAFGPRQLGLEAGEVGRRVEEALEAVRLTGYEHRVPHHLSAGERRRVAIASVLSMKPRVLILDEPTAHLDLRSEELLVEILRNLPVTKILISHDMPLILALCRRAIVLHQGRVIRDTHAADLEHDEHLVSLNDLDYTFKNECCREIMALQEEFESRRAGGGTLEETA